MNATIENMTPLAPQRTFSRFVANLLKERRISVEMAETLEELKTPHLQLEALTRLRGMPEKGLPAIVAELRQEASGDCDKKAKRIEPIFARIARSNLVSDSIQRIRLAARFGLPIMLAFTVILLMIRVAGSWHPFNRPSAPQIAPASAVTPLPITPIAPPPTPPFLAPIKKPGAPLAPQNLVATILSNGMVHLTWNPAPEFPDAKYRLHSATAEDMHDAQNEQPDLIPMNWVDWMPSAESGPIWLAISRVTSTGRQTSLSKPVLISPPSAVP